MSGFVCTADDMHPYACPGPRGGCVHCLRLTTDGHEPETCVLCEATRPVEAA